MPASPFAHLSTVSPVDVSPRRALIALSRSLEARAFAGSADSTVWVCLQHARFLTPTTRGLYEALAGRGATVHLYGEEVRSVTPFGPGVHLHDLSPRSPLAMEWNILLVSDRGSAALSAQERPPSAELGDRRFAWTTSEQPAEVLYAASSLPLQDFVTA